MHTTHHRAPAEKWLTYGLLTALCTIPMLAAHSKTFSLWEASLPPQTNVWDGFRSVLISWVDLPLIAVLILGLTLWFMDETAIYRNVSILLRRYGGAWWMGLLIWSSLSLLWSREPNLARFASLHLLLELTVAFALAHLIWQGWERLLIGSFLAAAVIQSLLAIGQLAAGKPLGLTLLGEYPRDVDDPFGFGKQGFRGSGFEIHPNILSGFLVIALFLCLLWWWQHTSMWILPIGGIIGIGLLATISRTALAIALITLPLTWFLSGGRLPALSRRIWLGLGVVILAGGLGAAIIGRPVAQDLWDRTSIYWDSPQVLWDRLTFAKQDTNAVWRKSPLLGAGASNLLVEIGYERAGHQGVLLPVHIVAIVVLGELGIIGVSLYIMGCLAVLVRLHLRNDPAIVILSGCFLAICLIGLLDYYFWGILRSRLLIFWVIGVWWGYCLRAETQHESAAP